MRTNIVSHLRTHFLVTGIVLVILLCPFIVKAQWTTSGGGDVYNTNSSGKVGIGTSTPVAKLDVAGSIKANNHLILLPWYNLGSAPQGPWVPGYMKLITPIVHNEGNMFSIKIKGYRYGTGGTPVEIRCGGYAYSGTSLISTDCNTEGTADPVGIGVENGKVIITIGSGGGTWYYDHFTAEYSGWAEKDPNDFVWQFVYNTSPTTTNTHNVVIKDSAGTITTTGNVGIGTASPGALLSVGGPWSSAFIAGFSGSTGRIGVYSTVASTPGFIDFNSNGQTGYVGLNGSATNGFFTANGLVSALSVMSPAGKAVQLGDAGSTPAMTVVSGNVGIGTTSPGDYKLNVIGNTNVTGNINLTGSINAKYQDVAEWVPSSEKLSAGTVVVLDSTKSNQVTSSSVSYDTRVAGVVSEQPGIALGEKSESKVLVATTGRVRVKVDASKGPIHIGDLLVTSDVPGMAMKSEPVEFAGRKMHMPGTLIGKALEPLDKGTGTILVLLSLQ